MIIMMVIDIECNPKEKREEFHHKKMTTKHKCHDAANWEIKKDTLYIENKWQNGCSSTLSSLNNKGNMGTCYNKNGPWIIILSKINQSQKINAHHSAYEVQRVLKNLDTESRVVLSRAWK